VEAAAAIGAVLVERQAHEALEPCEEDATLLEDVLVVKRDVEQGPATASTVARALVAAGPSEAIGSRGAPAGSSALRYGDRHPAPLSRRARPRAALHAVSTLCRLAKSIYHWWQTERNSLFPAWPVDAVYNRV